MFDPNTQQDNTSEPAAIYVRISADKAGRSLGVERQEEACRTLASARGWTVTQVYKDNDLSAYSGKSRPGYNDLLALMKSGQIRVVVAIHTDRLHRSPIELESFITLCEANDVRVETVQAGPIDLSSATGRMGARIYGAVARHEVEHMIERQKAAKLQSAQKGQYLGGQRPYGFERRRTALREDEAEIIRQMAQDVIDGASFRTVAIKLNKRKIVTQHGASWTAIKVRNILIRPINGGIVRHLGVDYEAESPSILTRDQWDELVATIKRNKIKSGYPSRTRRHVLNGFLYCGICGSQMYHKSKQQRTGGYKTTTSCGKTDTQTGERRGCGGVSRMAEPIIDLVTDALIYRLSSPDVAQALQTELSDSDSTAGLLAERRALERRVQEATDDYYVSNLLSRDEYERVKLATDDQLRKLNKQIDQARPKLIVKGVDIGSDIRAAWENAELQWRRDLLSLLITQIIVNPRPKEPGYTYPKYKGWRFDPELIEIRWRA